MRIISRVMARSSKLALIIWIHLDPSWLPIRPSSIQHHPTSIPIPASNTTPSKGIETKQPITSSDYVLIDYFPHAGCPFALSSHRFTKGPSKYEEKGTRERHKNVAVQKIPIQHGKILPT